MTFVLASNNRKKLVEMREILSELGVEVISLAEAGVHASPEETGATFAENALIKADAACSATGMPSVADDSGLVVDALGGAPGVYSARYGGEGLSDTDRYLLLLKNMEDKEQRGAAFVSSIACRFPDGTLITSEGTCPGEILRAPAGDRGFGYDPVFFLPELGRSMAQLTAEEKNAVSHRGQALRVFAEKLREHMESGEIHDA